MKTLYKHITVTTLLYSLLIVLSYYNYSYGFYSDCIPHKDNNPNNYLRLKGKVLNEDKVSIRVFEYNDSTQTWKETKHIKKSFRYDIYVDPTKHYQIWFANKYSTKKLYVLKGHPGPYFFELDVDFDNPVHAQIQQTEDYNYIVSVVKKVPDDPTKLPIKTAEI
jgi:hypothetical protein